MTMVSWITPQPPNSNLNVDDTGNTFAGTINGKFCVYIDPYSGQPDSGTPTVTSTTLLVIRVLHLMTLVCSIVLTFLSRWFKAVGENSPTQNRFQDLLRDCGANPYAEGLTQGLGRLRVNSNRATTEERVVKNLM